MDETWLCHYDPQRKQQWMEWRHSGSLRPAQKKFQVKKFLGKFLTWDFWDQEGIHLIDYLRKGQTINPDYYSCLLVELKDVLMKILLGKFTKLFLFLQYNAPALRALATHKKQTYLGLHCLDHQPFSPYLSLSNYHLFSELKNNWIFAIFLPTRRSLLQQSPTWTDKLLNYFSGFQNLQQRAKKWIELRGKYVE